MSAIRPGLPLNTPAQGLDLPSARSAQAAFFRAALNQNAVEQTATPRPPVPAAAVMSTIRTANPARPVEAPPAVMPATPLNLRLVGVFYVERGADRALARGPV